MIVFQRSQERLDVADGKEILQIIYVNQKKQVILRILLLIRRRNQLVLGIIVDHRFGEDLLLRVALAASQLGVHKRGDLVHVKRNVGHILRENVA